MPKKSKKNPTELANGYRERLAHAVNNTDKWAKKVIRIALSKKYPTSADDRQKIVDYLGTSFDVLGTSLTGSGPTESEDFKL